MYVSGEENVECYRRVVIRKSFCQEKFLKGVRYPVEAALRGLVSDPPGTLALDGYSSITHLVTTEIDISRFQTASCSSQLGDLVKVSCDWSTQIILSCYWLI